MSHGEHHHSRVINSSTFISTLATDVQAANSGTLAFTFNSVGVSAWASAGASSKAVVCFFR